MGKRRRIDPAEKAYWDNVGRDFRAMYERRMRRIAELDAAEARRRERLRRLTLGLLGRS
jgi:hypothetical protein